MRNCAGSIPFARRKQVTAGGGCLRARGDRFSEID